ncbi:DUF2865 domain-containing protein [uncultured Rhodoblastus sp.]|uniref:DUF2865 domain-containing protein n=1 Tax=uncultured Rhodoblastus sp. TaxID=543037 RepID=UPI0025F22C8A|nr:DUF2865 domain-containing protein [uncultured Rhodoblastus sp.]
MSTRQDRGGEFRVWRWLALACGLLLGGQALAQNNAECARLRAALAAPSGGDPAAASAARKIRAELDQLGASAHSAGCDNQQFLIFGTAPPSQCAGLKARLSGLRAQFDSLSARASGDSPQRRALVARANVACGAPREKGFFETLFGALGGQNEPVEEPQMREASPDTVPTDEELGRKRGGSQALCVRSCDGGFFPLNFSASSANSDQLLELCKALCPNAEMLLFTRNPGRDISTAVSADGFSTYESLPNALKYASSYDSNCGCKPPNQSWVEAYAHAEELLGAMGGAKASDTVITEQQSQAMSQPTPAKPAQNKPARNAVAPAKPAPANNFPVKTEVQVLESLGPDGAPRQVRVVGPKL